MSDQAFRYLRSQAASKNWPRLAECADVLEAELVGLRKVLRLLEGMTPHVRGCDKPDDPLCPGCIVESEVARLDEVAA